MRVNMESSYVMAKPEQFVHQSNNISLTNFTENFDPFLELERENNEQFTIQVPAFVYTIILMLIGTPGNVVVLYVYFFKWRKSTSRMFILFLTALDLVNCVTTLPMELFIMRYSRMLDKPWLCKFSRFLTYTMNSSSAAILVAIAVDRFKRICRPHGLQFSARQSKYVCLVCVLFALCLTWPSFVLYGTRTIHLGKVEGKSCLLKNQFDLSIYPYIYFIVMMGCTLIIFTTLSVLYYFVGLQVYKHRKLRMKRKAEKCVAKNLVEREHVSRENKEDTLLQDSDSAEFKKQMQNGDRDHQNQNIEMKPLPAAQPSMPSGMDSLIDNDSQATYKTVNKASDKSIDKKREKRKKRRSKNIFSKRSNGLQDSIVKANGKHCVNMKLRIGRSTLMLFLITIAYIISFLPFYTIAIMRQTYKDFVGQLSTVGHMAYHVFLRSYLLSSAINPIIYSFCNAQFRTFCLDLFRKKQVRRGIL